MLALTTYLTVGAWLIQPADPKQIRAAAALCIDEFEKLPLPLLPFPGWQERAREEAISKWTSSRVALLQGQQVHALIIALRNEAESGRFFEGVDDSLLGFAEVGLLPAPPEQPATRTAEAEATAGSPGAEVTDTEKASEKQTAAAELFPYLANLAVKTGARRLGLGKELVLAAERKAAELGFSRMYIKVDRQNFEACDTKGRRHAHDIIHVAHMQIAHLFPVHAACVCEPLKNAFVAAACCVFLPGGDCTIGSAIGLCTCSHGRTLARVPLVLICSCAKMILRAE